PRLIGRLIYNQNEVGYRGLMAETIVYTTPELIPELVASVSALFAEDAGRHDPGMDTGWPGRHGAEYYSGLLDDDANSCLLARVGDVPAGHLIGYLRTSEI